MRWPLRRQILLPMATIVVLAVGVASGLSALVASRSVERQLETQLVDTARTLASTNFPLEPNVLRQARGLTGADYVVESPDGKLLAASDDAMESAARSRQADEQRGFDWQQPVNVGGRTFLHAAVPLDRRPVGGDRLRLHAFYPEAAWRAARWQAMWPPLVTGLAAVAFVAAAAYGVARHVTQPVQQLKQQVSAIAEGDFRALQEPKRDDEIRELAIAVNQMAERLASYEAETRQSERLRTLGTLGAGIAHQIRNAATGCRIALDLHRRDCSRAGESGGNKGDGDTGNGAPDEPLAVAFRQLQQIETTIQRFLALGRPAAQQREPCDLANIVEQAVDLARPLATHLGVAVVVTASEQPLRVLADREALVQMVVNLVTNAVEATARAATSRRTTADVDTVPSDTVAAAEAVEIRLRPTSGGRGELAIGDTGPGPSAVIADRLFEPFSTDKPGGTGLGLVVARQAAEDHGGCIRWRRADGRTWFIVELPLEKTSPGRSPAGDLATENANRYDSY